MTTIQEKINQATNEMKQLLPDLSYTTEEAIKGEYHPLTRTFRKSERFMMRHIYNCQQPNSCKVTCEQISGGVGFRIWKHEDFYTVLRSQQSKLHASTEATQSLVSRRGVKGESKTRRPE